MNVEHPAIPHIADGNDKTFPFPNRRGRLKLRHESDPGEHPKTHPSSGALGAGCGKKGNTETNNPGAANRPEAETPKLPPTKPEVADISKTLPLPSQPVPAAPKTLPPALVAAWEKAGFQAKWKGPDKESGKIIVSDDLEKLDVSKTVLRFEPRRNDFGEASVVLKSLPAPAMSFGLDLSRTEISDVDLKS